jgi:excisionase family DNA binding protein
MNGKFITIKNVANILGVSRATLRNWDNSGKLKAHRHPFNNYRVYRVEDIDEVIEMLETNTTKIDMMKTEVRNLIVQHLED